MIDERARMCRILTLAWLTVLTAARADEPRNLPPQKDTLQAVLDRIKQHAAGEAWKQPGFKDDGVEAWLDKLVGSIAKAAEIPDLKLPVRFKDVQPAQPQADARGIATLTGGLVVAKDLDWKSANVQASLIFADGNVDLGRADNSVIVAGGAIAIHGSSSGNVFVAGTLVTVDGFDGQPANVGAGSIIVSRGWVTPGSRSIGTIVAAHEGIFTGDTQYALFINSPVPQPAQAAPGRGGGGGAFAPARDTGSKSIKVPDLPLEALRIHPLGAKLKLLGVLHGAAPPTPRGAPRAMLPPRSLSDLNRSGLQPTAVIFQFEGRRYFADLGQPIVDEAGAPVAALQGWQLLSLANKLAILSGPEGVTVLRMDAK